MRHYIERSSDAGPSSLRLFCLGCIFATRGYDFREGQGPAAVRLTIVCQILLDERGLPSAVRSFIDHLAIHFREDELLGDASGPQALPLEP